MTGFRSGLLAGAAALLGCCAVLGFAPLRAEQAPPAASGPLPDWRAYMQALEPIGDRLVAASGLPDDPLLRQRVWRNMTATLAQGYFQAVYQSPASPEFLPNFSMALNLAAPNPDFTYAWTPIDGQGVYRLRGYRGTTRFTEITAGNGFYALGNGGRARGSYDLSTLRLGRDGSFDVILSAKRPDGYKGDWWELDPQTQSLTLRQAAYDWMHEVDARVSIDRLDRPASPPAESAQEIARRLQLLPIWVEKGAGRWFERFRQLRASGVVNRMEVQDWGAAGGAVGQVYLEGMFRLAPDEALVLDSEVPAQCRYWSFLVGDDLFQTIDFMNRQSSLNGFQARIDRDGRFRAVVSATDPGVPNWLDTGGMSEGLLQARWNNCSGAPMPRASVVKIAALRSVLPRDTPVVSPAERERTLRDRKSAYQLRRHS